MKKPFLFLSIVFLTTSFVASSYAQQMMIGVRGSVNLANQHYKNLPYDESISTLLNVLAGGQFDYWFNNSWAMSIQILYDEKVAHGEMSNSPNGYMLVGSGTADWTTSYLEIPLLAKVRLGKNPFRPYVFAGPSIGFLISNIEELHTLECGYLPNGIGIPYTKDTTANITEYTNKIDLSIVAGGGISVTLKSGGVFFVDAAYAFGLINSYNYSWDNAKGIYVYSRDIRIAAGVLFPLN